MGDRPIARPRPTHDNITQENADLYPYLHWDSILRSPLFEEYKIISTLEHKLVVVIFLYHYYYYYYYYYYLLRVSEIN
jgi:hypothetical protein